MVKLQVNTSGQFVGVAEMTGAVDFEKTLEYWQQDKWNGSFSVKWHIVKDVPNKVVWYILNNVPFHRELATPSVILPVIDAHVKVDRSNHLSYTTELTNAINLQRNHSVTWYL